ncbi:nucleotidyltransferase [Marinilactibacillus psychrotolerans]|uniref:nucleotidyltransferase n=1 Tax=Marinilactibacillus psychrotolerans TaxID=191770 RepID=UPI00186621C9|nr:nucleotidyltransferase [Marinilactibacillus psychrotolerans]
MEACGIIAEYNPFHNGHLYQLQEAKKRTGAEVIIVVMSGNFLQRGEPAIVDKWKRAQLALAGGADLIVELPVSYSVQPADLFAKGAIEILAGLGCASLSFGAESGNGETFKKAAKLLIEYSEDIDYQFKKQNEKGKPYAVRMEQAIAAVIPSFPINLSKPNNQLGLAYAKENYFHGDIFHFEVIGRKQADYHDVNLPNNTTIASATAIRKQLLNPLNVQKSSRFMPAKSLELLDQSQLINWNNYWHLLKYQIISSSLDELQKIYQMEEGLENRLKKAAQSADSFERFIQTVKNKRMTRTRLQRLCIYVLLQIKQSDLTALNQIPTSRILGFSPLGQQYLNKVKKTSSINLLTKINKRTKDDWSLDIKAGEVYQLALDNNKFKQDFNRKPLNIIDITTGD